MACIPIRTIVGNVETAAWISSPMAREPVVYCRDRLAALWKSATRGSTKCCPLCVEWRRRAHAQPVRNRKTVHRGFPVLEPVRVASVYSPVPTNAPQTVPKLTVVMMAAEGVVETAPSRPRSARAGSVRPFVCPTAPIRIVGPTSVVGCAENVPMTFRSARAGFA